MTFKAGRSDKAIEYLKRPCRVLQFVDSYTTKTLNAFPSASTTTITSVDQSTKHPTISYIEAIPHLKCSLCHTDEAHTVMDTSRAQSVDDNRDTERWCRGGSRRKRKGMVHIDKEEERVEVGQHGSQKRSRIKKVHEEKKLQRYTIWNLSMGEDNEGNSQL